MRVFRGLSPVMRFPALLVPVVTCLQFMELNEQRYDMLSQLDGLNCGSSVGNPKSNGLLKKKKNKGLILKQKGTRMTEDGED